MILPGIADNRRKQLASLQWIREISLNDDCVESLASHDVEVQPHIIELKASQRYNFDEFTGWC